MQVILPFISRIIAVWIVSIVAALLDHFHIQYTPDDMSKATQEVIEFLIVWVLPIFITVWQLLKVAFDKKFNPSNASTTTMVKEGRELSTALDERDVAKKNYEKAINRTELP